MPALQGAAGLVAYHIYSVRDLLTADRPLRTEKPIYRLAGVLQRVAAKTRTCMNSTGDCRYNPFPGLDVWR